MPLKIPEQEILDLASMIEPQHQAIKEMARHFKLTYSEAALLLIDFHINDMHNTANLYKATLNPQPKP